MINRRPSNATVCSSLLSAVVWGLLAALSPVLVTADEHYYPGKWDEWEVRPAEDLGIDQELLSKAIAFSTEHESSRPRDLDLAIRMGISRQTHDELIGPTRPRGGLNGMVLRSGYIVAEWGETKRVDMTFSATKSYLSTVAGLAHDERLIRDVRDNLRMYVHDGTFDSEHNAAITWHALLNQTSEWEGTLWGKPDWAPVWNGEMRKLHAPGTHWQYNDVRVNCLALALLHVWRKPLPQVLKERIMDPIDASPTWRWYGYTNSWVNVDGVRMQSVSGGGHWGGGLQISTRDHARFGYLFLREGRWKDRQLISKDWIDAMRVPTDIKPVYGYMWWLNTDRRQFPSAPESSYFALGAGTNMVWIDPDHDLVVVVRWIAPEHEDEFIRLVLAAIEA